jgi:hypothetical protein
MLSCAGGLVILALAIPTTSTDATMFFSVEESGCFNCETCGLSSIRHVTEPPGNPDGNNRNGPHAWCMNFPGCSGHAVCGGGASMDSDLYEELLEDLDKAHRGDLEAVERLATSYEGYSTLEIAQQAIHVRGCTKSAVVGFLQLEGEALAVARAATISSLALAMR